MLLEHFFHVAVIHFDQGFAAAPAADQIQENVRPPEGLLDAPCQRDDLSRFAHVRRVDQDALSGQVQGLGESRQFLVARPDQNQPRALLGEFPRRHVPQRAGGAGNNDNSICKIHFSLQITRRNFQVHSRDTPRQTRRLPG